MGVKIEIIPSKSFAHRAMICAALSENEERGEVRFFFEGHRGYEKLRRRFEKRRYAFEMRGERIHVEVSSAGICGFRKIGRAHV